MAGKWTLDDIAWDKFDPALVDPETLKAVKAAAMVEANAADYVTYLNKVFRDDPEMLDAIRQWGEEEVQHGFALGRWAELADPEFSFERAFARFREGYKINEGAEDSVRGARSLELIARCVVESGTSSFYSGMRDDTAEPVLKQIAANIAADEFRHYKLFYEGFLKYQPEERPNFFKRLWVAMTRVQEAEDDELAYAYYAANVKPEEEASYPYDRDAYSRAYNQQLMRFYHFPHLRKAVSMIVKPVGLKPTGYIARGLARVVWWAMRARAKSAGVAA